MIDTPYQSKSVEATMTFGQRLAGELSSGDVVALHGPLGSGKTHLVKGIAQEFGVDAATVHSPTFSLINEYDGTHPLYHFDCYRIESIREMLEVGAEDYFYGKGICLIEWPERIAELLPAHTMHIDLQSLGCNERQFSMRKKKN